MRTPSPSLRPNLGLGPNLGLVPGPARGASPSARRAEPPNPLRTMHTHHPPAGQQLGTDRVISSIPRSSTPGPSSCPVNHEQETGTSASGNWIYPSEKMFFDAMKRKGYDAAQAADMKTVVPIHNAVNERAWAEILRWEQPYVAPANAACGGPRLHSFAGLSENMSPQGAHKHTPGLHSAVRQARLGGGPVRHQGRVRH